MYLGWLTSVHVHRLAYVTVSDLWKEAEVVRVTSEVVRVTS